jgi:hypothetical protein
MRVAWLLALLLPAGASFALVPRRPIPRINQRHPNGSGPRFRGDSRCGPTAMAMVARAFRYRDDLNDVQLIRHFDRLDGKMNDATSVAAMVRASNRMGLRHSVEWGFRRDFVDEHLGNDELIVLLGRYRGAPYQHYIVVTRALLQEDRFLVKDPWPLPGGANAVRRMTAAGLRAFVRRGNGAMLAFGAPAQARR